MEIFLQSKTHPYTWGLLASMPSLDTDGENEGKLTCKSPGTPARSDKPRRKGDAFALRSDYAMKIDFEQEPPMFKVSDTHYVKSWLLHPNAPKVEPPASVKARMRELEGSYEKPVLVKEGE
ncbi:hypothetical protein R0I01_18255 [Bacillus pumilus]|nr:hypothetical protein R0I01_18255 [Bacillus pumilus]